MARDMCAFLFCLEHGDTGLSASHFSGREMLCKSALHLDQPRRQSSSREPSFLHSVAAYSETLSVSRSCAL